MAAQNKNNRRRQKLAQPIDTYGHVQPQATDVEKAIIGAMLIDKNAYALVSENLVPDAFYDPRHRIIFEAISNLALAEKPIDILTVAYKLKDEGRLEEVGGPAYIAELSSCVASSASVEYHSLIIAQKYEARQLIALANEMERDAFNDEIIEEVSEDYYNRFEKIRQAHTRKSYVHVSVATGLAIKEIQTASGNDGTMTGLPSGYNELDFLLSGFQKEHLIIVGGRPAMGKTTLGLNIAWFLSVINKNPTAIFSLEMSSTQLLKRILSNHCNIEHTKLINGSLQRNDWDKLDKSLPSLLNAPLYLDDTPELTTTELKRKVQQMIKEHGIKIVVVDYLQLMKDDTEHHNTRQEEVTAIARALQELAKEVHIPIIALSQVGRDVDKREGLLGLRPRLSDIRESGAIEQSADVVIFVHRPEYYQIYQDDQGHDLRGMALLIVAKNRHGSLGDVTVKFEGEYTRFVDPESYILRNAQPSPDKTDDTNISSEEAETLSF